MRRSRSLFGVAVDRLDAPGDLGGRHILRLGLLHDLGVKGGLDLNDLHQLVGDAAPLQRLQLGLRHMGRNLGAKLVSDSDAGSLCVAGGEEDTDAIIGVLPC